MNRAESSDTLAMNSHISPGSDQSHQSTVFPEQTSRYRNNAAPSSPSSSLLPPPHAPFASRPSSSRSSLEGVERPAIGSRPASLSINYVPTKFTKHEPGTRLHRPAKRGGGREAFSDNAGRMGGVGDDDDDAPQDMTFQLGPGGLKSTDKKKKRKLRWNRFKWALFVANFILLAYSLTALIAAILVWLDVFDRSDVLRTGNKTELIISTVAAVVCLLTAIVGWAGIILNNRPFLAVYTFMLWICFALIITPGYITYKKRTFNLEGKINAQWSRGLGTQGRLRIQNQLRCCGYFSPFVEATVSNLCYSRSSLPGCKPRYLRYERDLLKDWYIASFVLVPVQLAIIITALLSSNHITYRFGKGLTPKRYRLDLDSMALIMDEYASQIAAQYGPGVADEAMKRSSSNLSLETLPFTASMNSRRGSTNSGVGNTSSGVYRASALNPEGGRGTVYNAEYEPSEGSSGGQYNRNTDSRQESSHDDYDSQDNGLHPGYPSGHYAQPHNGGWAR